MSRKKLLLTATISTITIGIGFLFVPFIGSWGLRADAGSHFIRYDPADLTPGKYEIIDSGWTSTHKYGHKYLAHNNAGSINIFRLYTKDDLFIMPFSHPFDIHGFCAEIKVSSGIIGCSDETMNDYERNTWRWDLSGKRIGSNLSNLESQQYSNEINKIVIGMPSVNK